MSNLVLQSIDQGTCNEKQPVTHKCQVGDFRLPAGKNKQTGVQMPVITMIAIELVLGGGGGGGEEKNSLKAIHSIF